MRRVRICASLAIALTAVVAAAGPARAQDPAAPPPSAPAAVPPPPSRALNPDISVIGNFRAAAGKNAIEPTPSLEMTEAELAFQAAVDPYATANFFVAAGPEGAELEEGYITFTTLPAGLLLKAGKMRAQFGKVNVMHTHVVPWADRPLVLRNLLGGDEGLADSGVSVSKLIPNDALFLEATGEVYQGASSVFHTDRRSRLMWLGRLRGYRDLTENMNLDVGTTFTHGPTDLGTEEDPLDRKLYGIDLTFRWRPLQRALYRRFVARTELLWSRQDLTRDAAPFDTQADPAQAVPTQAVPTAYDVPRIYEALADPDRTAFGFYTSADYQFARRWYAGGRIDRSARALAPSLSDSGASAHLSFWPTEFSVIRAQYRRTKYAEGVSANELFVQFNFSIGAHGAHVF